MKKKFLMYPQIFQTFSFSQKVRSKFCHLCCLPLSHETIQPLPAAQSSLGPAICYCQAQVPVPRSQVQLKIPEYICYCFKLPESRQLKTQNFNLQFELDTNPSQSFLMLNIDFVSESVPSTICSSCLLQSRSQPFETILHPALRSLLLWIRQK